MPPVEGDVQQVSFWAGLANSMFLVQVWSGQPNDTAVVYHLLLDDPASEITRDGTKITSAELAAYLVTHRCRVKLFPILDRYGAVLKADFSSDL